MGARVRTIFVGECTPDKIFHVSDPDAPSESQFEFMVVRALSCVYPNYLCFVFGGSFRYDDRFCRPDLALVARDYSHWFIVEVELTSHSLEGHVLPQAKAFRYGDPQSDCVPSLSRELNIEAKQAQTFLNLVPRSVLVVANKRLATWEIALRSHDVQVLTVSVFQSRAGVDAVEVDGTLEVVSEHLGFSTYSAADRSLRFPKTVKLPIGQIQINDPEGGVSTWTVAPTGGAMWVTKNVGVPNIRDGSYVQLIRTIDRRLSLRHPLPLP